MNQNWIWILLCGVGLLSPFANAEEATSGASGPAMVQPAPEAFADPVSWSITFTNPNGVYAFQDLIYLFSDADWSVEGLRKTRPFSTDPKTRIAVRTNP